MTQTEKTELMTLPPAERAAVVMGTAERKLELKALAKKSFDLVEIRDQISRDQIHRARIVLKDTRVDLEKKAKAARDDANAFSKAVIGEEKALIGLIQPEETRLQGIQSEWDDRQERERAAKAELDRARIQGLQDDIQCLRDYPAQIIGASSGMLEVAIKQTEDADMEGFAELKADAIAARDTTLAKLRQMMADAKAREDQAEAQRVEGERLKAEREQFERDQAEAKAKREAEEAAHRDRMVAEETRQREAREAQQRILDAQQAEVRRQQAEVDAQRRAQEDRQRAIAQAEEDRQRAERQKAEDEAAALRRAAEEAQAQRIRNEQEAAARAIADERARAAKELEAKARAQDRLAAAAPALLAALKAVYALHDPDGRFAPSHYKPVLRQVKEAIALAEEQTEEQETA